MWPVFSQFVYKLLHIIGHNKYYFDIVPPTRPERKAVIIPYMEINSTLLQNTNLKMYAYIYYRTHTEVYVYASRFTPLRAAGLGWYIDEEYGIGTK